MISSQRRFTESMEAADGNAGRQRVLKSLLQEISRVYDHSVFCELRSSILEARQRLEEGTVYLAILGQMKRGKSSLLNALLGEDILPTGVLPLTSVVTEISYGENASATILYQGGTSWDIALDDIHQYITEAGNPGNRKGVLRLVLRYPSNLLQAGIVLVDTPGLGSTYSHNTEATRAYLSHVDAAIVVFSVDPPITEAEAEFVKALRSEVSSLVFVLNKTDLVTDEEVLNVQAFILDELVNRLGIRGPCELFPLSTRQRDGRMNSGFNHFVEYLQNFTRHKQNQTLYLSILENLKSSLELANFSLTVGGRLSRLSPAELEEKRQAIGLLLTKADHDVNALKTLLRQEQTDLIREVGQHLDEYGKEALPQFEARFESFRISHRELAGTALGDALESFLNGEVQSIFRDWRVREDAYLAAKFAQIVGDYTANASGILDTLTQELEAHTGFTGKPLSVYCGLAMDAKVSYAIERVYFSLDRFLLLLPPFLQRPLVYRRVRTSVPLELDRNAGRIRFDYRERIDRSFTKLEQALFSQIQSARQSLSSALRSPEADEALLDQVTALQSYVDRLLG